MLPFDAPRAMTFANVVHATSANVSRLFSLGQVFAPDARAGLPIPNIRLRDSFRIEFVKTMQ